MIEADLSGADLFGANLQNSDFQKSDFSNADLRGASLRGSDFSEACLAYVDLRDGALLSVGDDAGLSVVKADNSTILLNKAVLIGANLAGARLANSAISQSDLSSSAARYMIAKSVYSLAVCLRPYIAQRRSLDCPVRGTPGCRRL